MSQAFRKKQDRLLFRIGVVLTILSFLLNSIILPFRAYAQSVLNLPIPGVITTPTPKFIPPVMKGIKIFPDNPLRFDFIIDTGDFKLEDDALKTESTKLIKYFLATLTVPEDDLWVNLSPYEEDRIISNEFGVTEMGRDLLVQDYILKQLTASLVYPERDLGKKFWDKVYAKVNQLYGTTRLPVNTFNKVWVVPDKAVIYESGDTAFIIESHLKVMLESDYLSLKENLDEIATKRLKKEDVQQLNDVSSAILKEVILPEIEKEVNTGEIFASLRQVYNSMILATWFKRNLKKSFLNQVYVGRNKIAGVDVEDKQVKEKIYKQYLETFKKGVYNYIKEDYDPATKRIIRRKYFSGGIEFTPKAVDKILLIEQRSAKETETEVTKTTKGKLQTVSIVLDPVKNLDHLRRILNVLAQSDQIPQVPQGASEEIILEFVLNHLQTNNLIKEIRDEAEDIKVFVIKDEVKESELGRAVQRWVIEPQGGVKAINFKGTDGIWKIVGFESDIDQQLDLELEEVKERKAGKHWIVAYNNARQKLRSGDQQIDQESAQKQFKVAKRDGISASTNEKGSAIFPPEEIQQLQSRLNSIETEDDLRVALDFISKISPSFGKIILEELKNKKIPIQMTNARSSNIEKSLYCFIHRNSVFASQVNIRRGATVLEVIHELTHAVPIQRLPAPLREVTPRIVDTNKTEEEIKQDLIRMGYLDEALSFTAEILFADEAAGKGFNFDFDTATPGLRASYNAKGIDGLADDIPHLMPHYQDHFERLSTLYAPLMKKPIGELMNIPWTDTLESYGIEVSNERSGISSLSIDPKKVMTGIAATLVDNTPEELVSKVLKKVGSILEKWQQYRRRLITTDITPEMIQDMNFPPQTKQNPRNANQILEEEKEQTVNRVKIAGGFLQFLDKIFNEMEKARKGDISEYFRSGITAAKHLDGDQAALLWQKLYSVAKSKIQEKPEYMRMIGFALLEKGYTEQGVYALQVFIDAGIKTLHLTGKYGYTFIPIPSIGDFLVELLEHNQLKLAKAVYTEIMDRVMRLQESFYDDLIRSYGEYYGKYVGEGRSEIEKFVKENKDRDISSEEFHQQILLLRDRGLYRFYEYIDPDIIKTGDYEERYFEKLSKLDKLASTLSKASRQARDLDSEFADALKETASFVYDLSIKGAQRRFNLRIREWSKKSKVPYEGNLQEFINTLENHPEADKNFEFEDVAREIQSLIQTLAKEEDFLEKKLDFLRSLPMSNLKLSAYKEIASQMKPDIPQAIFEVFVREWEETLHVVAQQESANFFIEKEVSCSAQRRMEILKRYIKDKIEEVESELGITYDTHSIIRNFARQAIFAKILMDDMDNEDIMQTLFETFHKDISSFQELISILQKTSNIDEAGKIYLLKRFSWFLPDKTPREYLQTYTDIVNNALEAYTRQHGLGAPKRISLVAGDYRQSKLFQEHSSEIANMFLAREEVSLKEEGRRRILALSGKTTPVLSPHKYRSPTRDLFGKDRGGLIHTINEFLPALFKLRKLIEASERDSENLSAYLYEAEIIQKTIPIDVVTEDLNVVENKLFTLMKLYELYVRNKEFDKAESLFKQIQLHLHRAQAEHKRRLQEFENLPSVDELQHYILEDNVEKLEFWMQDLESRQRIIWTRFAYSVDKTKTLARLDEIVESFEKEVSQRRSRFDICSMISAASILEEEPELHQYAQRIYELAIEKLALLRGEGNAWKKATSILVERIDEGKLPNEQKDVLLAKAIRTLVPPKGKRDWIEMLETIPGLLELADKVIRKKIYPESEKEVLEIFVEITEDIQSDRAYWEIKLIGLRTLFDKVITSNPEIAVHENFDLLMSLSEDENYQLGLALLHKENWRKISQENGRALSVESIRSGAVDLNDAIDRLIPMLDTAIERGNIPAINSVLTLLVEVMNEQIATFLLEDNSVLTLEVMNEQIATFLLEDKKRDYLTIDQLQTIRSFNELYQRVESILYSGLEYNETQECLINALLDGKNKESARAKFKFYRELLGNPAVNISIRRKAFEGLILAGKVDNYTESFFSNEVLENQVVEEQRFYGWINRMLELNQDSLFAENLLAFLFQNPSRDEEFFEKYERMKLKPTMLDFHSDMDHEIYKKLNRLKWKMGEGSNSDYQAVFTEMAAKYNVWIPNIFDEIEMLIAYQSKFSHSQSFEQWIADIRNWFYYEVYQISRNEGRYNIDTLEHILSKIAPEIRLTEEQREYLRKYLQQKGSISYKVLTQYLGITLSQSQKDELVLFLHPESMSSSESIAEFFGIPKFDEAGKRQLDETLDRFRKNFDSRREKIKEETVEMPDIFKNSPPLIRYALIRYFKQLSFGEREAILADFKTEGLTEEQAFRKFFEVTGNEKLGQFLSLRCDLIPERFRKELERFQEDVEPSAFEEVKNTIEKELGAPIEQFFTSIDSKPLQVGTIGEVYRVVLKDGTEGVIKVITPSKRKTIERNLQRIKRVALDIDKHKLRFGQKFDIISLFNEYEASLRRQLDLRNEFRNAVEFRKNLPKGISISHFYDELVRESVLVQSFVKGVNPTQLPAPAQKLLPVVLGDMLFTQITKFGIFHDDLHPGNIRVAKDEEGGLSLLDFGDIGRLEEYQLVRITKFLQGIHLKDIQLVFEYLPMLGKQTRDYDCRALRLAIERIIHSEKSMSQKINELFFESGVNGLQIDSIYLKLIKAILTFEGTAQTLDPEYDLEKHMHTFVMKSKLRGLFGKLFGSSSPITQKPIDSTTTTERLRVKLAIIGKRTLSDNEMLTLANDLKLQNQVHDEGFKKTFPLFWEEFNAIRRLLNGESVKVVLLDLMKFYKTKAVLPNITNIEVHELIDELIDDETGLPILATADVRGETLHIYITPGNAAGVFREIYEHLILPLNSTSVERKIAEEKFPGKDASSQAHSDYNFPHTKELNKTAKDVGGIDLNPNILELQTQGTGIDFDIPIDLQAIQLIQIEGFSPVILQIIPTNLPMLMGTNEAKDTIQVSKF